MGQSRPRLADSGPARNQRLGCNRAEAKVRPAVVLIYRLVPVQMGCDLRRQLPERRRKVAHLHDGPPPAGGIEQG